MFNKMVYEIFFLIAKGLEILRIYSYPFRIIAMDTIRTYEVLLIR